MSNRRKIGRYGKRRSLGRASGVEPGVDFALAQMFRSECPDCGCEVLRWFTSADAPDALGHVAAARLLQPLPVGEVAQAECWQCTRCGSAGAFGATNSMGL